MKISVENQKPWTVMTLDGNLNADTGPGFYLRFQQELFQGRTQFRLILAANDLTSENLSDDDIGSFATNFCGLAETAVAQPALFVVEYALWAYGESVENARRAAAYISRSGTPCSAARRRQSSYSGANVGGSPARQPNFPRTAPSGVCTV